MQASIQNPPEITLHKGSLKDPKLTSAIEVLKPKISGVIADSLKEIPENRRPVFDSENTPQSVKGSLAEIKVTLPGEMNRDIAESLSYCSPKQGNRRSRKYPEDQGANGVINGPVWQFTISRAVKPRANKQLKDSQVDEEDAREEPEGGKSPKTEEEIKFTLKAKGPLDPKSGESTQGLSEDELMRQFSSYFDDLLRSLTLPLGKTVDEIFEEGGENLDKSKFNELSSQAKTGLDGGLARAYEILDNFVNGCLTPRQILEKYPQYSIKILLNLISSFVKPSSGVNFLSQTNIYGMNRLSVKFWFT